jgi:hypothetical protein
MRELTEQGVVIKNRITRKVKLTCDNNVDTDL